MRPSERLSLGGLIDALAQQPADSTVSFQFGGLVPTTLASYRGYYDDLALGFDDGYPPTVSALLERLRAADGAVFHGWKGGEYRMSRWSRLWVANPGHCGDTAIIGVKSDRYGFTRLVTALDED